MRLSVRLVVVTGWTPIAALRFRALAGPSPGGVANTMVQPPEPDPAVMLTMPQIARSAVSSHSCQPTIARSTDVSGNFRVTTSLSSVGKVRNVNEVTTPKLPPPPPRSAQNRSALLSRDAVITSPSATTTEADTSASHVRPDRRASDPTPPPNVKPATPTVGQLPLGIDRPFAASAACTESRSAAGEIVESALVAS